MSPRFCVHVSLTEEDWKRPRFKGQILNCGLSMLSLVSLDIFVKR